MPPLFWVVDATRRASFTPLGRDQGIFQYIAWAIGQGQVDYRDIRDVNGPLTHLVHVVLLALGGADEHRFRLLDLGVTGATFAFVGACLPGLSRRRAPDWIERAVWAAAGWVVLSGQYLLYGYWHVAQRESFFDWFMLPSVGLQLAVQAQAARQEPVRRGLLLAMLAAAGALGATAWLGKPTYLLFTLAQCLALTADRDGEKTLGGARAPLKWFGAGCLAGVSVPLLFLLLRGDAAAYFRIQLTDVPTMYRFIWARSAADILSNAWHATHAIFAITGAMVLVALVLIGQMPARVLAAALVPVCGLGSVLAQAKGFPYHFHPVTAGVHLQWLVFAAWLADRAPLGASPRRTLLRAAPILVGAAIALRVATSMEDSPYIRAVWLLWGASTAEERQTQEYFAHFPEPDFFPFEMRQAADYLRDHTKATDRVQVYGMDPYLLFLARRLSATPYIYGYDLNADAALAGGTGGRPSDDDDARIAAIRAEHEAAMVRSLRSRPPAAFVFLDSAPLLSRADAWTDFEEHCSSAAELVGAQYRETAKFGHDHVWLRRDLEPDSAH